MFLRITMFVLGYAMLLAVAGIQYWGYEFQWWVWNWQTELAVGWAWGDVFMTVAVLLQWKEYKAGLPKPLECMTEADWKAMADRIMAKILV